MKKNLALCLALIMMASLLPVLGVSAEEAAFDLSAATTVTNSSDDTPVGFIVTGNSATLNGSMNRAQSNNAILDFVGVFPSTTNLDEHVTQTIKIDTMPIFNAPNFQNTYYASGYFNTLTRNYHAATATPLPTNKTKAESHDSIMYSIYCKDDDGNLGMKYYNMSGDGNYVAFEVITFAEKLGEAFTLTTVWHADNKVTFICDGEELGTFDNATFAATAKVARKQYLSIGYNAMGTATDGSNPVNLTVSDVKISHGDSTGTDTPAETTPPATNDPAETTPPATNDPTDTTEPEATIPELIETPLYYSDFAKGPGAIVDASANTAVIEGKFEDKGFEEVHGVELLNFFRKTQEEYLIQDICIEKMPVFSDPSGGNSHISSGFYMTCSRNYTTEQMDYIKFTIYREDAAGNLVIALAKIGENGKSVVLDTEYPLNKKVGDKFRIVCAWHADGSVDLFCDGELIHSYDQSATYVGKRNSTRKNLFRIGYCSIGAEATPAASMDVKITLSNLIRGAVPTHYHTPAEDDGDCTTAVKCTTCKENAVEASPAHRPALRNPKYPTETETGYTGDMVCYQCDYVFSEGEEIPMLPKTSSSSSNQSANNTAIYVYIAIGAAVLVVAAVVVVLVVRNKQNRKEPKDSV